MDKTSVAGSLVAIPALLSAELDTVSSAAQGPPRWRGRTAATPESPKPLARWEVGQAVREQGSRGPRRRRQRQEADHQNKRLTALTLGL